MDLALDLDLRTDYFRAADEAAVQRVMADPAATPAEAFDAVPARRIDPSVALVHLLTAAVGERAAEERDADRPVWPTGPRPWETEPDGPETAVDLEDPWMTGPWVVELGDGTRDALARIERHRLPEIASAWSRTANLGPTQPGELLTLVHRLAVLARRARKAEQHLYCAVTA